MKTVTFLLCLAVTVLLFGVTSASKKKTLAALKKENLAELKKIVQDIAQKKKNSTDVTAAAAGDCYAEVGCYAHYISTGNPALSSACVNGQCTRFSASKVFKATYIGSSSGRVMCKWKGRGCKTLIMVFYHKNIMYDWVYSTCDTSASSPTFTVSC
jgi:hypothetical protein